SGSAASVEWRCPDGHLWRETVARRTRDGASCPVCSGREVRAGVNDLATTHPELAAEADDDPTALHQRNDHEIRWRCSLGHEWEARVSSRVRGYKPCTVCSGKVLESGLNDLATTHPELATQ